MKVKAEKAKVGHLYKISGWGGVFMCIAEGRFMRLGTGHEVGVFDEKVKCVTATLLH